MGRYRELTTTQRMLVVGATAFILCTAIVLGSSVQNYAQITMREGEEASFWSVAEWPAVWWYAWALLTPFFFELGWRVPITRRSWFRPLLILIGGMVVAFVADVAIQVLSMELPEFSDIHPDLADAIEYHVLTSLYLNILIYWMIIGAANAVRIYRATHLRALRASELEAQLTQARLDSLKMQLHPHFLFNTLNGISSLMYRDVALADRMVTRLSSLLRRALDRADAHEVSLGEEIDLLREYLSIEQLRFGDRLAVSFEVEEGIEDVLVPSFVYQPLVENSIKHAIKPRGNAGSIAIGAQTVGDALRLSVADDGPGLEPGRDVVFTGVGLATLYDRLDRLYGEGFAFDLRECEPHGLIVEVTVPIRHSSRLNVVRHHSRRVVTEAHPRVS